MIHIPKTILEFNKGRIPELLGLKYKVMRSNSFSFFRGTCHLFYDDLARSFIAKDHTKAWICGDLHLENFGTYKGDNRAVYFDLNDFDEAILAPCTWELARILSSIHVGAATIGFSQKKADALCNSFIETYSLALSKGKAGSVEKDTVQGIVRKFLVNLKYRKREEFIQSKTVIRKNKIRILIDHRHTLPLNPAQKKKIVDFMDEWRSPRPDRKFFKVRQISLLWFSGHLKGLQYRYFGLAIGVRDRL